MASQSWPLHRPTLASQCFWESVACHSWPMQWPTLASQCCINDYTNAGKPELANHWPTLASRSMVSRTLANVWHARLSRYLLNLVKGCDRGTGEFSIYLVVPLFENVFHLASQSWPTIGKYWQPNVWFAALSPHIGQPWASRSWPMYGSPHFSRTTGKLWLANLWSTTLSPHYGQPRASRS